MVSEAPGCGWGLVVARGEAWLQFDRVAYCKRSGPLPLFFHNFEVGVLAWFVPEVVLVILVLGLEGPHLEVGCEMWALL